jgi:CHASE3 domain sensor protein
MSEPKSTTARIFAFFALILVIICFNSWFLYHNFDNVRSAQSWVSHTRDVISELDQTLLGIRTAETSQRAYVLTQNPDYIRTYRLGRLDVETHEAKVCSLIQDNSMQVANCNVLHTLLKERIEHLDILLAQAQRGVATKDVIREALFVGTTLMNSLSEHISRMKNEELSLFKVRDEETQRARSLFFMTLVLTTVLTLVVSIYAFTQLLGGNARALKELTYQTEEASARENLAELTRIVAGDQPFATVSHEALSYIGKRFGIIAAKLFVREHHAFRLAASIGIEDGESNATISESSLLSEAAQRDGVLIIDQVPDDFWKFKTTLGTSSPKALAFVPILFQARPIGIIELA